MLPFCPFAEHLWIFLGGPYIEKCAAPTTDQRAFRNHGAVVGIVLNLAVWIALNALFPNHRALDWVALGLAIVAFVGMLR